MSWRSSVFRPFVPLAASSAQARLRRCPGDQRAFDAVNRYVCHHGGTKRCRTVFGAAMTVDIADFLQKHVYLFGEWEPLLTRYLLDRPRTDRPFIDVGANIGYTAFLGAQRHAEVHAIEASPSIARFLRSNVERNPDLNVTVHEVAVGEKPGSTSFFAAPADNAGRSSSTAMPGGRSEGCVTVKPLIDIVGEDALRRAAFVKIDVEGAELSVVRGLLAREELLAPDLEVLVEASPHDDGQAGKDTAELVGLMRSAGFEPRLMQGVYDLRHYQDRAARSALPPLDGEVEEFSDLLFQRG